MSDEHIVFEALRHRYPTLMVYNLRKRTMPLGMKDRKKNINRLGKR
ncbi:hypothetical protein [Lysinibacillus xylanilyticus]